MFFHCMTPTRLASGGVIQWEIIKVWYKLQYIQICAVTLAQNYLFTYL